MIDKRWRTGHRTFDKQTNALSIGPCRNDTQWGVLVDRGRQSLEMRVLRAWSISMWELADRFLPMYERFYVYMFFHTDANGAKTIHAHIVTDEDDRVIYERMVGPTYKSLDVLEKMSHFLAYRGRLNRMMNKPANFELSYASK